MELNMDNQKVSIFFRFILLLGMLPIAFSSRKTIETSSNNFDVQEYDLINPRGQEVMLLPYFW